MSLDFSGALWHWAGPSPYYFVTVPQENCQAIKAAAKLVSYGWGMIPVRVKVGDTEWKTSLFPKGGQYLVPVKDKIRKAEGLVEGDVVALLLEVGR